MTHVKHFLNKKGGETPRELAEFLHRANGGVLYVFGANGVFVAAANEYVSALIPVLETKDRSRFIRGLEAVRPYVKLFSKVPAEVMSRALNYARLVHREGGHELYLSLDPVGNWVLSTLPDENGADPVVLRLHYNESGCALTRMTESGETPRIVGDVWGFTAGMPHVRFRIGIMAHQAVISHRLVFEQGVEVIDA